MSPGGGVSCCPLERARAGRSLFESDNDTRRVQFCSDPPLSVVVGRYLPSLFLALRCAAPSPTLCPGILKHLDGRLSISFSEKWYLSATLASSFVVRQFGAFIHRGCELLVYAPSAGSKVAVSFIDWLVSLMAASTFRAPQGFLAVPHQEWGRAIKPLLSTSSELTTGGSHNCSQSEAQLSAVDTSVCERRFKLHSEAAVFVQHTVI
jgi:hypothetical protein